jgi:hypothetical protein
MPNRRENFRVEVFLPLSIHRIPPAFSQPPQLIPAGERHYGAWSYRVRNSPHDSFDHTFVEMLIETDKMINLLLESLCPDEAPKESAFPIRAIPHILANINSKLECLLKKHELPTIGNVFKCCSISLSAGGIRTHTDEKYMKNERVQVRLLLEQEQPLLLVICGRIVRIDLEKGGGWEISVAFENVTDDIQQEIINFSLRKQKEQMIDQLSTLQSNP